MRTKAQVGMILMLMLVTPCSRGGVALAILNSFSGTNGGSPAAMVQGTDGSFYGITAQGGPSKYGTVFKMTPTGTLTNLVLFAGSNGAWPTEFIRGDNGNFFGATFSGGTNVTTDYPNGAGTIFQMTPEGTLTTMVSFNSTNGADPNGKLIQGADGNVYGTTMFGGMFGWGTAFKMSSDGMLTTLASFNITNGWIPRAGLARGSDGNFYGTTTSGGAYNDQDPSGQGYGTVFKVTTNSTLTILHSFTGASDGAYPVGELMEDMDGNFYGTTAAGGASTNQYGEGYGTIFKITPAGALTTLVSFDGSNGKAPGGRLVRGTDGNLYGITQNGGTNGDWGTVFQMAPNGELTSLVSFNGTNGINPSALLQGSDGNFYGTTSGGGASGKGTVFRLDIPSAASPKIMAASNSGGEFTLTWFALQGRTYQVQFAASLTQTGWNNSGSPITATNSTMTASETIRPRLERFYRLVLLP